MRNVDFNSRLLFVDNPVCTEYYIEAEKRDKS